MNNDLTIADDNGGSEPHQNGDQNPSNKMRGTELTSSRAGLGELPPEAEKAIEALQQREDVCAVVGVTQIMELLRAIHSDECEDKPDLLNPEIIGATSGGT